MKIVISVDCKSFGENHEFRNEKDAIKYLKCLLKFRRRRFYKHFFK